MYKKVCRNVLIRKNTGRIPSPKKPTSPQNKRVSPYKKRVASPKKSSPKKGYKKYATSPKRKQAVRQSQLNHKNVHVVYFDKSKWKVFDALGFLRKKGFVPLERSEDNFRYHYRIRKSPKHLRYFTQKASASDPFADGVSYLIGIEDKKKSPSKSPRKYTSPHKFSPKKVGFL